MLKYLIFITIGILLYLLLNIYNTFSIGVPVTDLNEIFPDADYPNKVPSDEDEFGAGIPRELYQQGLRLGPGNLIDIGYYYRLTRESGGGGWFDSPNRGEIIFISAINIPIVPVYTGTAGQTQLVLPTPTYLNYHLPIQNQQININGTNYTYLDIRHIPSTVDYDVTIRTYRLLEVGDARVYLYLLDDRIIDLGPAPEPEEPIIPPPDLPPPRGPILRTAVCAAEEGVPPDGA